MFVSASSWTDCASCNCECLVSMCKQCWEDTMFTMFAVGIRIHVPSGKLSYEVYFE